ncbi:MAG: hypothetical protein U0J70_02920, partial [Atopobiaceae bacterium]|nr:hypothetical protein [Atopobiaceae bacterium]
MKKLDNIMVGRRQALALGFSGALGMTLAACGGSNDGSANTDAGSAEAVKATVTVWGPQEDQSKDNGKWLQT